VMLPMWLLAGTFFPPDQFPAAVQPVVRALPLTQLNDALRAVVLDGATFTAVASKVAYLAAWAVGSFALAVAWFRWQ
jgi:ABC-2 type transport system permease protein